MTTIGSDHDEAACIRKLLMAPTIRYQTVGDVTAEQGVYVLWLSGTTPTCLKVGIAGPRRGKGLRERLRLHFSSNEAASVLARHLAADTVSPWSAGRDFTQRVQRRAFLADACYFQVLPLAGIARPTLLALEAALIGHLRPAYVGRVGSIAMQDGI